MATNTSLRDIFFETVYGMVSESAQKNGPAQGSNFWNLYTVGIANDDPFKVSLDDASTMDIIKRHVSTAARSPEALLHACLWLNLVMHELAWPKPQQPMFSCTIFILRALMHSASRSSAVSLAQTRVSEATTSIC